nr:MAG TPA: transcriptional activator [Caudoviricetes sp.]
MLNKDLKKRMDRELRQYWINKKKLERLERDIIDESASGNGQPRANTVSNPTEKKAIRLTSTRSILYCKERITYVENVIKQLNSFEKQVFYLIFKDGCDWSYCKNIKNIDKSTYYNIYNKSIRLLAEEWGEI